jgi:RHS repeat-associated protein
LIAQHYAHNLISGGVREIIRREVSTSGPIVEYLYHDWLGRQTLRQVPSPTGSGYTDQAWHYNSSGQLWKHTRTGAAATLYSYDTMGQLFREGLDLNANDTLDLASDDRITDHAWTFFTASSNWWRRQTTSTYATSGNGTATEVAKVETQLSGLPTNRLSHTDSFDVFGNLTTQTVDVNRAGKLLTTTVNTPDSTTDSVQIAYNGLLMSTKDTAGITLSYEYDALGRQKKSIHPRTGATETAYKTGTSQIDWVKDPAGTTQATYTYNGAGLVSSVKNALNRHAYFSYNLRGQKTREWGQTTYPVEYVYDSQGRIYQQKTYAASPAVFTNSTWPSSPPAVQTTTWNYHAPTGLLSSKTDAANKSVTYTYTQAGQIATRTWARGTVTTYSYSSTTGELTGVSYSDSTPGLTHTYNRLGQSATVADYTGTRTFTYNLSGTLELQREDLPGFFGSRRLTHEYDTATGFKGRPDAFKLGTSGNPTLDQHVTYGYQADGRLNAIATGGQSFGYSYVTNSHLIGTIANSGTGYADVRTYDPNHNWVDDRTTAISSDTKTAFSYTQDVLGRVTQIDRTGEMFERYGNGTQGLKTTHGYNDRSEMTSDKAYLGGTSTVLTGRDFAYTYDYMGNRKTAKHNTHNGTYNVSITNAYSQRTVSLNFDVAGAADSGATVTVNGSSSGVTRHGEYFFKPHPLMNSSNPVFTTLTVSDGTISTFLDAFVAKTPEVFGYDLDGNLKSDGRWVYSYDAENRLIWLETAAAAITAGHPKIGLEFYYDYLGRRVRKLDYTWSGSAWVEQDDRRFIYRGWNQVAEFWGPYSGGSFVSTYSRQVVRGMDLAGPGQRAGGIGGVLMVQEGGESYLPAYDALGNVHAMIKASDGSIAAAYEYDAYGRTLRESGPYAAQNPFRFSTKYTDIETGLVYHDTRYYAPSLGRFINRDSIGEQGGLNLYAYVSNRVPNAWDYLGMSQDFANGLDLVELDGGGGRSNLHFSTSSESAPVVNNPTQKQRAAMDAMARLIGALGTLAHKIDVQSGFRLTRSESFQTALEIATAYANDPSEGFTATISYGLSGVSSLSIASAEAATATSNKRYEVIIHPMVFLEEPGVNETSDGSARDASLPNKSHWRDNLTDSQEAYLAGREFDQKLADASRVHPAAAINRSFGERAHILRYGADAFPIVAAAGVALPVVVVTGAPVAVAGGKAVVAGAANTARAAQSGYYYTTYLASTKKGQAALYSTLEIVKAYDGASLPDPKGALASAVSNTVRQFRP